MTLFVEFPESTATANGVSTTFNVGFTFETSAELEVSVKTGSGAYVIKTLGVDYLIAGDDLSAAQVVFQSGHVPANGAIVKCRRNTVAEQPNVYGDLAGFKPSLVGRGLDRLTRMVQEARRDLSQAGVGSGGVAGVASVNGRTNNVALTAADVTSGFGLLVADNLIAGSGILLNTGVDGRTTITSTGGAGGGVSSVAGRTGAVLLTAADVASGFSSAVNGALQAGSNIALSFSGGKTVIAFSGVAGVSTVAGRAGAVVLTASDVATGFGAAVGAALAAGSGITVTTVSGVTTIALGSAGVTTTFDTGTTGSNLAYSNGNLTATKTTTTGYSSARSSTGKTAGKLYFEVTATDRGTPGDIGVGVARSTYTLTGHFPGDMANSVGLRGNGIGLNDNAGPWVNGAADLVWSAASTLFVALDAANGLVWFKKSGGTNWNNSGSANPSSGVGGLALSGSGSIYAVAALYNNSVSGAPEDVTINFGQNAYVGAVPAGFTTWDGTTPLGGVAGVATFNGRSGAVSLSSTDIFSLLAFGAGISGVNSGGVLTLSASGGGGAVSSVNGRTGAVALTAADVSSGFGTAVNAALAPGTGINFSFSGGVTTINATGGGGGLPFSYTPAWENGVTTANTASTNTANLNALISAVNVAGGGTIRFNAPGAYQINGTISLKSNVGIEMVSGAYFLWTGSASGICFQTPPADVLAGANLEIAVNEGGAFAGVVFDVHSGIGNRFKLTGLGTQTAAGVFAKMFADSTAGISGYPGLAANRNFAFNEIHLRHLGVCGYGLILSGITSGYAGQPQGATDNTFFDTTFANVLFRGIKIDQWADSNAFVGKTYIGLTGVNSAGVVVNEGRTNNYTVYNTKFVHLSIDSFGSGLNRSGVVLFESKMMFCDEYFNDPEAENGHFSAANCLSYRWVTCTPATNNIYLHEKAFSRGL